MGRDLRQQYRARFIRNVFSESPEIQGFFISRFAKFLLVRTISQK